MSLYKIGKVVSVGKTYIILESNYTGYVVNVARSKVWEEEKDKVRKVYLYKHRTEFQESYYGFSSFSERMLFDDLLTVNGVGPRTALNALREGEERIIQLIASGDANTLASFPQLGTRVANQIVFELRPKYETQLQKNLVKAESKFLPSDIKSSLKTLGFNQRQIEYALDNLAPESSLEIMVEKAIKLISSAKPA